MHLILFLIILIIILIILIIILIYLILFSNYLIMAWFIWFILDYYFDYCFGYSGNNQFLKAAQVWSLNPSVAHGGVKEFAIKAAQQEQDEALERVSEV